MVGASFPLCLTQGVHPIYLRLSAFISGQSLSLDQSRPNGKKEIECS